MEKFGSYLEDILLAQIEKKYKNFKHQYDVNQPTWYSNPIHITDIKDESNRIVVHFTIPANGKRKEKVETYSYETLLRCATHMNWSSYSNW